MRTSAEVGSGRAMGDAEGRQATEPVIRQGVTTRTRRAVIEALFRLLEREDLSSITVTQLAAEAGIARRTFYLNYHAVDDVLREYIGLRFADFSCLLAARTRRGPAHDAAAFYRFFADNVGFLRALDANGKSPLVLEAFEEALADGNLFDAADIAGTQADTDAGLARYSQTAVAAVLWRTAFEWLRGGLEGTPHDMAARFAATFG